MPSLLLRCCLCAAAFAPLPAHRLQNLGAYLRGKDSLHRACPSRGHHWPFNLLSIDATDSAVPLYPYEPTSNRSTNPAVHDFLKLHFSVSDEVGFGPNLEGAKGSSQQRPKRMFLPRNPSMASRQTFPNAIAAHVRADSARPAACNSAS